MSVFHLRFIVIQCVLIAALVALWLSGVVKVPFAIEGFVVAGIVLFYGFVGLVLVGLKRLSDAQWVANIIIRMGIVGMQLCAIVGLFMASKDIIAGGDLAKAGGVFLGAMALAMCVSMIALCANLWIEHSLRLLGWRDDQAE